MAERRESDGMAVIKRSQINTDYAGNFNLGNIGANGSVGSH